MDKKGSVSILIANHNSFEMIQLAIESIRYFTHYPGYKIIVYDDASYIPTEDITVRIPNMVDLGYLRDCHKKGWITLYENPDRDAIGHGGALNKLVNEVCDTEYAIILDCDIQILKHGWLQDLIDLISSGKKNIFVADYKEAGFARYNYRTGFYLIWFCALNMKAYKDGMQVDWRLSEEDRRKHPYTEEIAEFYPPENCKWTYYWNEVDYIVKDEFDVNKVVNDPGSQLYIKAKYYNPKGYKVIPVPSQIKAKFFHYGRISRISIPDYRHESKIEVIRKERFSKIRSELAKLREITSG